LRFDPVDQVHRVGRAGHPEEAIHSRQQHSNLAYPPPSPSSRNNSVIAHDYATAAPVIKTIPEDDYSLSPGQMSMRLPSIGSPSQSFPASAPPTAVRSSLRHGQPTAPR
jgi:hypothetical protein